MARTDYRYTLNRLQVAVKIEPDADGICVDATIHRFECCFELAWKLMKDCLDYEGIETNIPRACIREGWKQGMIEDAESWLDMQEKQRFIANAYDEATAIALYQLIKEKYAALLVAWDKELQRRWESDMSN